MGAIFTVTVRQLAGSKRLWLVLALVALPVLGAVLYHVGDSTNTPAGFADGLIGSLIISGILPLVMLLLATSAFGNELDDRTLGYLVLKPLARWKIVLPKAVAPIVVGGLPVAASGLVASALIEQEAWGAIAVGLGLLAGAAAYTGVFTWLSLATRHSIVVGLVYVFVWEASLAAYLDGVRFLSVRRYTLALIRALDDERLRTVDVGLGARAAAVGVAVAIVVSTLLAVRRLSRMDVP